MFKVVITMKRRQGLGRREFREHYEQRHVPLMYEGMPETEVYRRNYVSVDDPFLSDGHDGRSVAGETEFDVITEVEYSSREAATASMEALLSGDLAARIREDENQFIEPGSVRFYVVEVDESPKPWPRPARTGSEKAADGVR